MSNLLSLKELEKGSDTGRISSLDSLSELSNHGCLLSLEMSSVLNKIQSMYEQERAEYTQKYSNKKLATMVNSELYSDFTIELLIPKYYNTKNNSFINIMEVEEEEINEAFQLNVDKLKSDPELNPEEEGEEEIVDEEQKQRDKQLTTELTKLLYDGKNNFNEKLNSYPIESHEYKVVRKWIKQHFTVYQEVPAHKIVLVSSHPDYTKLCKMDNDFDTYHMVVPIEYLAYPNQYKILLIEQMKYFYGRVWPDYSCFIKYFTIWSTMASTLQNPNDPLAEISRTIIQILKNNNLENIVSIKK